MCTPILEVKRRHKVLVMENLIGFMTSKLFLSLEVKLEAVDKPFHEQQPSTETSDPSASEQVVTPVANDVMTSSSNNNKTTMTATTYRDTDMSTAQDTMTSEQLPLATAKQSNAAAHETSLTTDIQYDEDFENHKGLTHLKFYLISTFMSSNNMGG